MKFNTLEFIFIFFPIFILTFFLSGKFFKEKIALTSLILASILFYGLWNILDLPILIISLSLNYLIGRAIFQFQLGRYRKFYFVLGILFNIILLFYFKYSNYAISKIESFGLNLQWKEVKLPLALSFITFQQIAFLVGAYRKQLTDFSIRNYLGLICFFPHLVAGPIVLYNDLMPQFSETPRYRFSKENFFIGLYRFGIGLSKKVLIADNISSIANYSFDSVSPGEIGLIGVWVSVLAYAMQLYFDFSGYSDMALGLAKTINIDLPVNFLSPYKSFNIIDFWRSWHVTLSSFLKTYLYIPLGGGWGGEFKKYRNLFITMLIGGAWHGAGINFVIWGFLHGSYLIINHLWRKFEWLKSSSFTIYFRYISWLLTFLAVLIAWIPFRAKGFTQGFEILKTALGFYGIRWDDWLIMQRKFFSLNNTSDFIQGNSFLILLFAFIVSISFQNTHTFFVNGEWKKSRTLQFITGIILAISILSLNENSTFLYFVF
ncbi:MBOAT family O-acyltransferase [Leptospira santarosai]|uniref:MBOAT family O-acyltransferase n=1 Tax=Leptospira santarosai TaxID=28183 RepID=UPI000773E7B3|nr:MBOAT family O-acyltransferase [Leptospira santarosai]